MTMQETGSQAIGPWLQRIDDNLRQGLPRTAKAIAAQFVETYPDHIDGWVLLGRSYMALGEYGKLLDCAQRAVSLDANHATAELLLVEGLLQAGRNDDALSVVRRLEQSRKFDPAALVQVGYAYSRTNRHGDAARCYERVRVLKPGDRQVVHNLTGAYMALGENAKAEALFDELLRKFPREWDAYWNRASLRKVTAERNHIATMEAILAHVAPDDGAVPVLCYALAKELEDIKEHARSFAYLKRAADAYCALAPYDVSADIADMSEIARHFDAGFFAAPPPGHADSSPIFILGMPRTGTTLVDRILSSHSTVGSVGESCEFVRAMVRQAGPGRAQDEVLPAKLEGLDWQTIGGEFDRAVRGLLPGVPRLLDKTPKNFLYLGPILAALPDAKIVHMRRHPVDTCYAIYKTIFRQGYPWSYDLEALGRYYVAYDRLMAHWRAVLPGRFLDLDYEVLVADQEGQSRRLVAFCGLEWEEACLAFERNASPSLTASAGQVRQPIYASSVALWRRYEEQLQPLIAVLREGGIAVD